jgi:hypothetical protein
MYKDAAANGDITFCRDAPDNGHDTLAAQQQDQ